MQPVDTNRPGFQPLGCGSICTPRALPWAGIGARRWRLSHPPGVDFWGASQLRLFLKLTHYPEDATRGYGIGRAFSPWAVALSTPRASPWAGIGARRWRLRPSAGWIFGGVTTSAFSQTDPLPILEIACGLGGSNVLLK